VRYVRNITDVGHLENDADEGEDKIQKSTSRTIRTYGNSKLLYSRYHQALDMLNTLPPSIEPFASGHIPEQIELIEEILIMVMHIFLMVQYILMSLNTRMILIYMAF